MSIPVAGVTLLILGGVLMIAGVILDRRRQRMTKDARKSSLGPAFFTGLVVALIGTVALVVGLVIT
jgi:uncharacterized membrane protein